VRQRDQLVQAPGAPDRRTVRRGRGHRSRGADGDRSRGRVRPDHVDRRAGHSDGDERRAGRRPSSTPRRSTPVTAPGSSTSRSPWGRPSKSGGLSPFTPGGSGSQQTQAEGTGYVYDKSGDIITADHVVDGATKITVRFKDGSTAKATLVGTDPSTDTAVIKSRFPRPSSRRCSWPTARRWRRVRASSRSEARSATPRASRPASSARSNRDITAPNGYSIATRSRQMQQSTTATPAAR